MAKKAVERREHLSVIESLGETGKKHISKIAAAVKMEPTRAPPRPVERCVFVRWLTFSLAE
jgi:hypothetical protein